MLICFGIPFFIQCQVLAKLQANTTPRCKLQSRYEGVLPHLISNVNLRRSQADWLLIGHTAELKGKVPV